ncbi:MAG TPA: hypothetical protein P5125_02285 [Kiritimatiellia bacterium]|jgi:hypothetical protein|nr:hypothetical protein [Kiritimatiellia bacterium]
MRNVGLVVVLSVCALAVRARTVYVDLNTSAVMPDGMTWETAYPTIGEAVSNLLTNNYESGSAIYIAPGHYALSEPIPAIPGSNPVTFYGVTNVLLKANPGFAEQVIIDGQNATNAFEAIQGYAKGSQFHGLTIVNCRKDVFAATGLELYGGSAINARNSDAVISNCIIRNCWSGGFREGGTAGCIYGGAVAVANGSVVDTLFEDNGITNACASAESQTLTGLRFRGGAICGGGYKEFRGNIFRRNSIVDPTGKWGDLDGGAMHGVGTLTADCRFETNRVWSSRTDKAAGRGGAVFTEGSGKVFSNLVFVGNSSVSQPVCVNASAPALFTHCTFVGNRTERYGASLTTSLKLGAGNEAVIRHCLFKDNYSPGGVADGSGTAVHAHLNDTQGGYRGLFIHDCAFVGNVNKDFGMAALSTWSGNGGAYVSLSNCYFEANLSATNSGTHALLAINSGLNFSLVDCSFIGNQSGNNGNQPLVRQSGRENEVGSTTNSVVRNCFFYDNASSRVLDISNPVADIGQEFPGTRVESCTIAGNRLSGTSEAILAQTGKKFYVCNTAVWGNYKAGTADNYNLNASMAAQTSHSYIGPQAIAVDAFTTNVLSGNITEIDPGFADPAKGDFRLKGRSPLKNAGKAQPWMAGANDLSNQAVVWDETLTQGGCDVVRVPALPRIFPTVPDIGCFESWAPLGTGMYVK